MKICTEFAHDLHLREKFAQNLHTKVLKQPKITAKNRIK